MVEIPETYLIALGGMVFIPLFIFLMKMIMEQSNTRSKLDLLDRHLEETKDYPSNMTSFRADVAYIKDRLTRIEEDIKHLFRRQERGNHMKQGEGDSTGGF